MAHVIPDGWRQLNEASGAAQRETETLAMLGDGLSDAYTVYHAVHWTSVSGRTSIYGEIDFVVVNRAGALLLIEQKSGFLDETPDGLVKRYGGRTRNVPAQLARTVVELKDKLARRPGAPEVSIDYLLYCPDYVVKQPQAAGVAPERIVDARRRDTVLQVIRTLLPEGEEAPRDAQIVHRFLRDVIELQPDPSALIGQARAMVTRVSGGLAYWARQLEFEPFRLRVTGTAGSGKTQLALAEYGAALAAGRRPLYVCFNRPLADHIARVAPSDGPRAGLACTFHTLCELRVRAAGETPDFTQPDAFDALVARAATLPIGDDWLFDTLIVDEGQDFPEHWRDAALRHLRAGGRALWLEDPMQNLYGREPVALPGWVRLHANANYRSPRAVVRMLQALLPAGTTIEARGPFESAELDVLTYADDTGLLNATKEAITRCLAAGYRRADMAIVSFRGREQSRLMHHARLGPHSLRSFTGRYDLLGQPEYTDGEVLVESVYRFKGQAAPAVILAEVDFETLDERAVRKLFVGATRAMMKLVLVVSERADAQLRQRLG